MLSDTCGWIKNNQRYCGIKAHSQTGTLWLITRSSSQMKAKEKKKKVVVEKKKKKSDRGIKKTADLQAFWQENVHVGCDLQCSKNSGEICKYVGLVEVLALHTGHIVLILYIYTQFMCTHTLSSAQRISKSMHCWYVKAHYFSMPCAAAMLSKLLWGP